jgi:hypothetical protein
MYSCLPSSGNIHTTTLNGGKNHQGTGKYNPVHIPSPVVAMALDPLERSFDAAVETNFNIRYDHSMVWPRW